MNLMAFKCDSCGQSMSATFPPNSTVINAPTAPGWSVVVLTCLNIKCGKVLGSYTFPTTGTRSS